MTLTFKDPNGVEWRANRSGATSMTDIKFEAFRTNEDGSAVYIDAADLLSALGQLSTGKNGDEVMASLLEKHGIDVYTLVGFACGSRCVCSYLSEDNKPCTHCRARLISAEFQAWAERTKP